MKRIALVHPRYGLEISGGSETYARKIAEHLANRYEVEVLTTKAVDSATWKDWYVRDVEMIRGVTVRRFSVQQMRARDFQAFDEAYLAELAQGRSNLVTEKEWFEKHGPYAPALIRYLQRYRETYGAIPRRCWNLWQCLCRCWSTEEVRCCRDTAKRATAVCSIRVILSLRVPCNI